MAKKADIEHRDDLFHLKSEHGIQPLLPKESLDLRRENHAQTDGGNIIPVCKKESAFARHTIRRGCFHSHPEKNHKIHPLEFKSTGMDTVKRLRKRVKLFRDYKKLKWEVQDD